MADISKIVLPNGDEYNLIDRSARTKIIYIASYDSSQECISFDFRWTRISTTISGANINSAGSIVAHTLYDVIAFEVSPGETLASISASASGGAVYAFYTSISAPTIGSKSHNSSRYAASTHVVTNITVPDNCHWICVRTDIGGTADVV